MCRSRRREEGDGRGAGGDGEGEGGERGKRRKVRRLIDIVAFFL